MILSKELKKLDHLTTAPYWQLGLMEDGYRSINMLDPFMYISHTEVAKFVVQMDNDENINHALDANILLAILMRNNLSTIINALEKNNE